MRGIQSVQQGIPECERACERSGRPGTHAGRLQKLSDLRPIGAREFKRLLDRLGALPDDKPIGVAVSGGSDSMALALLAHMVRPILAFTVDHGLRPESASEARQVHRWLKARGIAHRVLRWRGPKPKANIQAIARQARYELLAAACRRAGIRHLLTGHQQEDQAETVLLRLGRGSGVDGLAGIPAVAERDGIVLLRPLLQVPRARLQATLQSAAQPWIDDPSNANPAFARTRVRQALPLLAPEGIVVPRLAATAGRMARARAALEQVTADLLQKAAPINAAGFAIMQPALLTRAPEEIGLRALSRLLMTIGGNHFPPRLERLERLLASLRVQGFRGATLHGCRLLPWRGAILVCREPAKMAPKITIKPGATLVWDNRFELRLVRTASPGLAVGGLGRGVRAPDAGLPLPVIPGLPGLWRGRRLLAAPHLGKGGQIGFTSRFLTPGDLPLISEV